jgi:hypothetical protein
MTPQHLSAGAGLALLAALPVLPGTVLFLLACFGAGSALGQVAALLLGLRYPRVREGRVAALFGLFGLVIGALVLIVGAVG